VNCWVWEVVSVTESGVNDILIDDVATAGIARGRRQNHTFVTIRNGFLAEAKSLAVMTPARDPLCIGSRTPITH
jgi:hypothetical protein